MRWLERSCTGCEYVYLVVLHETGELFDRRNVVLPEYKSFARTSRNRSKDQVERRDRCRDLRRARLTFVYAVLTVRTELSKADTVMIYMWEDAWWLASAGRLVQRGIDARKRAFRIS